MLSKNPEDNNISVIGTVCVECSNCKQKNPMFLVNDNGKYFICEMETEDED